MKCPKCGHAIHGLCCETCRFDLKQGKLIYMKAAASRELSALAAYIDNVQKENAVLDHAASTSLKKNVFLALCACLLLGLCCILQELEWGEFRWLLLIAYEAAGFAAIFTLILIPLHIYYKYRDLKGKLDKSSEDKYEIISVITGLLTVIGVLAAISQLVCKIVSWDPGRVFFNHVWTYLLPLATSLIPAEAIAAYLIRLSEGKYSRVQCTLWAAVAAVLCISLAVLLYMGPIGSLVITVEEQAPSETASDTADGLPEDAESSANQDKAVTGEKSPITRHPENLNCTICRGMVLFGRIIDAEGADHELFTMREKPGERRELFLRL